MRIAIYGDSFAAEVGNPKSRTNPESSPWATKLREMRPEWQIDNYARQGSCLWFTWHMFNKTHTEYDKHIIFVTQWDRHTLSSGYEKTSSWNHLSSIQNLERQINDRRGLPNVNLKELESLRAYWLDVDQDQQRKDMHKLMLEDMKRREPNPLMAPSFGAEDSLLRGSTNIHAQHISALDVKYYKGEDKPSFYATYADKRHNHMNDINLQLMAESMAHWIETGVLLWEEMQWRPDTTKPFEYYFCPR